MDKKPLLQQGGDGDGHPRAPQAGGLPSAPPGDPGRPVAPPPYLGGQGGGYGGVVQQQPYVPPYNVNHPDVKPPKYLGLNIFSTFCCCLLCGLIGLYMSTRIDSSWSQGNREMAFKQSRNAKRWGIGGIIGGLIAHSLTVVILGASIGLAFA